MAPGAAPYATARQLSSTAHGKAGSEPAGQVLGQPCSAFCRRGRDLDGRTDRYLQGGATGEQPLRYIGKRPMPAVVKVLGLLVAGAVLVIGLAAGATYLISENLL